MGTANFGIVGLDWQQRINWERLKKYRTERARERMKKHGDWATSKPSFRSSPVDMRRTPERVLDKYAGSRVRTRRTEARPTVANMEDLPSQLR